MHLECIRHYSKSLRYVINRRGPKTNPWRMPLLATECAISCALSFSRREKQESFVGSMSGGFKLLGCVSVMFLEIIFAPMLLGRT